jgi:DNA repair exonuclease SbcCD ATPase subunit
MRNLQIKYAKAQNFLCFGSDPIEIDFTQKGNVVLVRGINLDAQDGESTSSSNGAGKSSIPEIIVYTLFGKTIKHPKKISHKDVINNSLGKGLRTEVVWGDYRVVRTRKPDSLRLWHSPDGKWDDGTEITLGGQPATQKLIEEKIGLNYDTFVNVVVFTDNNAGSFLECDASNKREIVENLLSLEKYKGFADTAKTAKKDKKDEVKILEAEIDGLKKQAEQSESRIKSAKDQESIWRDKIESEAAQIKSKIKELNSSLSSSDDDDAADRYKQAVARISEINSELPALEAKRQKLEEVLEKAQDKLSESRKSQGDIQIEIRAAESDSKRLVELAEEHESEVKRLEKSEGGTCKYCFGKVSKENFGKYAEQMRDKASGIRSEADAILLKKSSHESRAAKVAEKVGSVNEAISTAKSSMSTVSASIKSMREEVAKLAAVEKPKSADARSSVVEGQIQALTEQLADKSKQLEGDTPFKSIIDSLSKETTSRRDELSKKEEAMTALEASLPYYDFWCIGFGDSGIRKFVIDGIIPALNARIAHWLQFLIDGRISLEFNNELEEKIERRPADGDPFVYHAMSGGERRRLNLAVSQAFAHVMMLSSGTCPSLVFLDEVTTNIDQMGVLGVYNMITELAKDRQVFITTHDHNLLEMLDGCEVITLEKKGGFTRLKNSDY